MPACGRIVEEEGIPELYFAESALIESPAQKSTGTLLSRFGPALKSLKAMSLKASQEGHAVLLVREGGPIRYLWSMGRSDPQA